MASSTEAKHHHHCHRCSNRVVVHLIVVDLSNSVSSKSSLLTLVWFSLLNHLVRVYNHSAINRVVRVLGASEQCVSPSVVNLRSKSFYEELKR